MKNQAGLVSIWRVNGVSRSGAEAKARLFPVRKIVAPQGGDEVTGEFIGSDGVEHVLPPAFVLVSPNELPVIENNTFASWDQSIPIGWSQSATPNTSYYIEPIEETGAGIRASVAPVSQKLLNATEFLTVSQRVLLSGSKLGVRLRPYQDCSLSTTAKGTDILALTGIGLTMGRHRVIFCIGTQRERQVHRIRGGRDTVVMLPGLIGAWNVQTIDLRSVWPHVRPSSRRPLSVELAVVSAIARHSSKVPWASIDVASIEAVP